MFCFNWDRHAARTIARAATMVIVGWVGSAMAQPQDPMEVQRLIWRCDYLARELGLQGDAAIVHSNQCVENGSRARARPRAAQPITTRARSKWQLARPSQVQVDLRIKSNDAAFSFTLTCMMDARPRPEIKGYLNGPAAWQPKATDPFVIDGAISRLEIDGADSGYFVSDIVENNSAVISQQTMEALSSGATMLVNGLQTKRPRAAVFDLSNGAEALASFQNACRAGRAAR
ncbi:MAG: hypothetical protein JWL93_1855 [Hyphomicrobiales bacterium]|nr:hypothetical protein [Hyphomicrobiales bacterium]